ncbi:LysR family transcriptional regulator [Brenneria roseae]|uniref:LysR family transcriptional regulator n=1 Tax=Brenneria roseae TaxID=1509241 RepID=UPI001FE7A7C3|nr:LysR family transcriptional regulator [Brenneria roseae]
MDQDIGTDRFDGRSVTLEQLRAFVFVADHGGFGRAGEELGRTQSTLSISLKRLEADIGCRLINRRQGHIVGLTDEGQQLLPAARDILTRTTRAIQSVRKFQLRGKITLGVPDDFRVDNLHKAVSWCLEENPELRVEITAASSSALAVLSERRNLDVVILKKIAGQPIIADTESVLSVEQLHWVSSKKEHFNNIPEIPLITFPEGCVIRTCAIQALERAGKPYFLSYVSASFENIRSAAANGLGIGLLPQKAVTGDLQVLSSAYGAPGVPAIQLILNVTTQGELYQLFADYLRRSLAE